MEDQIKQYIERYRFKYLRPLNLSTVFTVLFDDNKRDKLLNGPKMNDRGYTYLYAARYHKINKDLTNSNKYYRMALDQL